MFVFFMWNEDNKHITKYSKVEDINNTYIYYEGEDEYFRRAGRKNDGTGVEQLQLSMEGESYNSVSKQLQFLMHKDTCVKKQIQ